MLARNAGQQPCVDKPRLLVTLRSEVACSAAPETRASRGKVWSPGSAQHPRASLERDRPAVRDRGHEEAIIADLVARTSTVIERVQAKQLLKGFPSQIADSILSPRRRCEPSSADFQTELAERIGT